MSHLVQQTGLPHGLFDIDNWQKVNTVTDAETSHHKVKGREVVFVIFNCVKIPFVLVP